MTDSKDPGNTGTKQEGSANDGQKGPSDLVVGSVTFVIFIIFMTIWMSTGSQ